MAVEIDSIPGFRWLRLFANFLSLLCSVVSCIYVPLPNKKSGNLNLILLGSVGVYMNVSLSVPYNLKDLNFFPSYYFLFHQGLEFNETLLDIAEITE